MIVLLLLEGIPPLAAQAQTRADEQDAVDAEGVDVYGERVVLPELDGWLRAIEEQGYVVVPDWLDAERTRRLRDDLRRDVNPLRELLPPDRTTVRSHNLLAKTRAVDDVVGDLRLLALVQGVLQDRCQVSAAVLFDLLPGAKAQPLHQDDTLWPIPRPHRPFLMNAVIAVEDFTKANGATHLVPYSHLWHDQKVRQPPEVETVQMEMKAGAMVAWTGAMWHGGGANTTQESRMALNLNFNLAFLRQQENQYIGVPREEVAKMPRRLQRVLGYQGGYSAAGPGMVDLRDPLVMLDKIRFGYDVKDADMPRLDTKPEALPTKR